MMPTRFKAWLTLCGGPQTYPPLHGGMLVPKQAGGV